MARDYPIGKSLVFVCEFNYNNHINCFYMFNIESIIMQEIYLYENVLVYIEINGKFFNLLKQSSIKKTLIYVIQFRKLLNTTVYRLG